MASKTKIVNVALGRIGISDVLTDVDTETGASALRAALIFDTERDAVLSEFSWPFATAYATLGLVGGTSVAPYNYDWTYAYRYPADCLRARRIVTPLGRRDPFPPQFKVGQDAQGRLLFTMQDQAQLEYTKQVIDPEQFDAPFVSLLAWRLAASLAPSLSRLPNMQATAMKAYVVDLSIATASAANEGQQLPPEQADWITFRDGIGGPFGLLRR